MSLRPATNLFNYRGSRITTAPAVEPVTAAELRTYLRETATGLPDADAEELIAEARQLIEDHTGMAMITQSWQLTIDRWPGGQDVWWDGIRQAHINVIDGDGGSLRMPRYPLQSITSITTYDEDSNSTAVTVADVFDVDAQQIPGRITLQSGATWPVATRANNAIEVVYVCGYGDAALNVPAPLKRAVKQLAAYNYAHRGDGCDVGMAMKESGASGIVGTYRVAHI